jgi:phosphoribosylaminoimidazolecarboxamide formyltransferase/IMP cyclohydrolase
MTAQKHPRRAIISVYEKAGVEEFARELVSQGFEIVSSGGTARFLRGKGVPVTDVEQVTGFPEMLDGRVKTLHPKIHGGILARREVPDHLAQLEKHGIIPIDVVAVNLYPFAEVRRKSGSTEEEIVENIDIGGPSLVRSAAKNHQSVAVATEPSHYKLIVDDLRKLGEVSLAVKRELARQAFKLCSEYDSEIAGYFLGDRAAGEILPAGLNLDLERHLTLRYGENPHQEAGFYLAAGGAVPFRQIHGKEISYNNILDLASAWDLVSEFGRPACAIVKHTNPCGLAEAESLLKAYLLACESELPPGPVSRFGGIIACNRPLDMETALQIIAPGSFYEVIAAPGFFDDVGQLFSGRKGWGQNVRLVQVDPQHWRKPYLLRSAAGGVLAQTIDQQTADPEKLEFVSGPKPGREMLDDLLFAIKAVKHVKSNAIAIAKNGQLLGVGAGQMNRLASVRLALAQAGERARGAALASDGFFPFPDNIEEAAAAGVAAVIQPGGSVKDAEVIRRAGELGVSMVLAGVRHFRH